MFLLSARSEFPSWSILSIMDLFIYFFFGLTLGFLGVIYSFEMGTLVLAIANSH